MQFQEIDPKRLETVNVPAAKEHLHELIASLSEGWYGRRLLVEEVQPYPHIVLYVSWTGSHRVEAAPRLKIPTVPCAVIGADEADEAFLAAGHRRDVYGYQSWREYVAGRIGPCDHHKLEALEKVGLRDAAKLMRRELEDADTDAGHRE